MSGETLAGFEWAIMFAIGLGYLIYDLVKTKREIRRIKERERDKASD